MQKRTCLKCRVDAWVDDLQQCKLRKRKKDIQKSFFVSCFVEMEDEGSELSVSWQCYQSITTMAAATRRKKERRHKLQLNGSRVCFSGIGFRELIAWLETIYCKLEWMKRLSTLFWVSRKHKKRQKTQEVEFMALNGDQFGSCKLFPIALSLSNHKWMSEGKATQKNIDLSHVVYFAPWSRLEELSGSVFDSFSPLTTLKNYGCRRRKNGQVKTRLDQSVCVHVWQLHTFHTRVPMAIIGARGDQSVHPTKLQQQQ